MLDKIGEFLWCAMFLTPLLTIPIFWKLSNLSKVYRILLGLLFACFLSSVFFLIILWILEQNGLGPT